MALGATLGLSACGSWPTPEPGSPDRSDTARPSQPVAASTASDDTGAGDGTARVDLREAGSIAEPLRSDAATTSTAAPVADGDGTSISPLSSGGATVPLAVDDAIPAIADLLDAYVQLRDPIDTTVQVSDSADELTNAVALELAGLGYGLQQVSGDVGARFLDVTVLDDAGDARLVLELGELELRRRYRQTSDGLVPSGPLQVAGSRLPVVLDDAEFGVAVENDPAISTVRYVGGSTRPASVPVIALITPELVREVAEDVGGSRAPGASPSGLNTDRVEVVNRFYGESGFGPMAADRRRVDHQVVVFADDSMRLGETGKTQIRAFVTGFDERTDLITLVGCSNGPTALEIGNEGLALGRSGRVSQELRALGVPAERIVDEGCWSPVSAGDRFPSRGVVMELLREADA